MDKKNWKVRFGTILVIVSIIAFLALIGIPFLEMEKKPKAILTTVVFITAEVLFYSGGFLLGKEIFTKYKSKLNPKNWFKAKNKEDE